MALLTATNKGKLVVGLWSTIACVSFYRHLQQRKRKVKPMTEKPQEKKGISLKDIVKLFGMKNIPLGVLALSIVVRLVVNIRVARMIGRMGSLLSKRDWDALLEGQLSFALWTVPMSFLNSFVVYAVNDYALSLRRNMAQKVHAKVEESALSSSLSLDKGSAQKATEDVDKAAELIALMSHSFLKPTIETGMCVVYDLLVFMILCVISVYVIVLCLCVCHCVLFVCTTLYIDDNVSLYL